MTAPPCFIASPSFSWRKTSQAWSSGSAIRQPPPANRSTVSRTHAVASQCSRRNASRASDIGPWFVTTVRSSCQSGSPYSHVSVASSWRSSGSGSVRPSSSSRGT